MKLIILLFGCMVSIHICAMIEESEKLTPITDKSTSFMIVLPFSSGCTVDRERLIYGNHKPPCSSLFYCATPTNVWSDCYKNLLDCACECIQQRKVSLEKDTVSNAESLKLLSDIHERLTKNYEKAVNECPVETTRHVEGMIEIAAGDLVACFQWTNGGNRWSEGPVKSTMLTFTSGKKLYVYGLLANRLYESIIKQNSSILNSIDDDIKCLAY